MRAAFFLLLVAILVSVSAATSTDTLYHRLGGREGLRPMVSDFIDMVVRDPRLQMNSDAKKLLARVKPSDLKGLLEESVCGATGGPRKGASANTALEKLLIAMDLTPTDWAAIDGDFSAALVKFKTGPADQKDLRVLWEHAKVAVQ